MVSNWVSDYDPRPELRADIRGQAVGRKSKKIVTKKHIMNKRQEYNDKKSVFFGHQFCIINPLIGILCMLRHLKWVRNMKIIVDNQGSNVVILM